MTRDAPGSCDRWRRLAAASLDGLIEAEAGQLLEAHLRTCSSCRDFLAGMRADRASLRGLEALPLPDEVLAAVWRHTVDREPLARPTRRVHRRSRRAVAAAFFAAAVLGAVALLAGGPRTGAPVSERELAAAAHDLDLVLAKADLALSRSQGATIEFALEGGVDLALDRAEQATRRRALDQVVESALDRLPLLGPNDLGGSRRSAGQRSPS